MNRRRIVLTSIGSLGDVHPYLALAIELKARDHSPLLVTSEVYRAKVEREGIEFAPAPPDLADFEHDQEFMRKVMDPFRGSVYVMRQVVLPWIRETHAALLNACQGADLIVGHPLTYTVPIVAEQLGIRWVGSSLQPMVFFSATDPPKMGQASWLGNLPIGPWSYRYLFRLMKLFIRRWGKPIDQLRRDLGLSPSKAHPLLDDQFSEIGNLALFSCHFGKAQPDWPANTLVTGFPFFDKGNEVHHSQLSPKLSAFLESGTPPVVFTLGSSAVLTAGTFYRESFAAAKQAGLRAILLVGSDERNLPQENDPDHILIDDYAPYSLLFPQCSVVVHQGGIGTTAQALRAGKPMLIVPFSHDQPDNANRICKMGCGLTISRNAYRAPQAIKLIEQLQSSAFQSTSSSMGEKIRRENGVASACDFLESILESRCRTDCKIENAK